MPYARLACAGRAEKASGREAAAVDPNAGLERRERGPKYWLMGKTPGGGFDSDRRRPTCAYVACPLGPSFVIAVPQADDGEPPSRRVGELVR